jgi:hypothetical protein
MDNLERALVAVVPLAELFVRKPLLGEFPERFQTKFESLLRDH